MKQHESQACDTLTLENGMIQLKIHHASFSSLLTYESIPEEEESCVSDYSLASPKKKETSKKVHFGFIRTYKTTYGTDPPGEHSTPSTCDCGYSPEAFCSVDDVIEYRKQSKDLHRKDLHLLQITKAQFIKKEKKAKDHPSRPLPIKKRLKPVKNEPEPKLPHFLVVKAREDGSPDLWSRNSQCNQIKHNHSCLSTSAIDLAKHGQNSKTNLTLPGRLQPVDSMARRRDYSAKRKGLSLSSPGHP